MLHAKVMKRCMKVCVPQNFRNGVPKTFVNVSESNKYIVLTFTCPITLHERHTSLRIPGRNNMKYMLKGITACAPQATIPTGALHFIFPIN